MGQVPGSVGAQLEERYFLQKVKLGQGSFGTVWRAVDRHKGNTVAIKQLEKANLPRRGVSRQDIEREVSMMRACPHENITRIMDTFEDAGSIYLALEYCDGGDFGDKVRERGGSIDEAEVAAWMAQMCAAIHVLHSKCICHRDIKPDNFMVAGPSTLKLADFGLAIFLQRGKLAREKCGTPAFMAPELHHLPKRSPGYSFQVDVWAAGVSMYMVMFGGRHPFISDQGHLDEGLLLSGEMDFRDRDAYMGFFAFGPTSLRFSNDARAFCRRMAEPDPRRRISAEEALGSPWLRAGQERCQQATGRGAAAASPDGAASPVVRSDEEAASRPRAATPRQRSPRGRSPQTARGYENLDPNHPGFAPKSWSPPVLADPTRKGAGPDDTAAFEAAKLREQHEKLQAELAARKKREEVLMHQQRQLEEHQRQMQKQRSKELQMQNERLIQREIQLQRAEQDKKQMGRHCPAQAAPKRAAAPGTPKLTERDVLPQERAAPGRGMLMRGARCRYESGTYGWMEAVVQGFHEASGTYNLDVRLQAALDRIAPAAVASAAEAWPAGTLAAYHSVSVSQWLPAVVVSFNESDCTYNLDVRDHADIDRIRTRVPEKPADPARAADRPVAERGGDQARPADRPQDQARPAERQGEQA